MFDQAVINLQHEHKAAHQDEHGEEGHLVLPQSAHGAELEAGAQAGGRRWSHGGGGIDGSIGAGAGGSGGGGGGMAGIAGIFGAHIIS